MELTKVQFVVWGIRYNVILLIIISFNTPVWFEYNTGSYRHYGLWSDCPGALCYPIESSNKQFYSGAVVPRILMILGIVTISLSYAGALFAMKRLYKNTKLVVVLFAGMIEFFGAIFFACAFFIAFVYGPEVERAGDPRLADVGFSAIFALLSSLLTMTSSMMALICFYMQRQKVREDVIVLDKNRNVAEVREVDYVQAKRAAK